MGCAHKWIQVSENKQICEKCLAVRVRIENPYEPQNSRWKIVRRGV